MKSEEIKQFNESALRGAVLLIIGGAINTEIELERITEIIIEVAENHRDRYNEQIKEL